MLDPSHVGLTKLGDVHPNRSTSALYDAKARELARLFTENHREFAELAGEEIANAGPVAS